MHFPATARCSISPQSLLSGLAQPVLTAPPDASVRELLQMMGSHGVNQIPIVEGARIVGAVTREAVLHAIQVRATGGSRPLLE